MTKEILSARRTALWDFFHSKTGVIGVVILLILICMTLYAVTSVPLQSFQQWNNPAYWIDYPKNAAPAWTNFLKFGQKMPEHIILTQKQASTTTSFDHGISTVTHTYTVNYNYDSYPTDFMIPYSAKYGQTPPVLRIDVMRPDGKDFLIYDSALPPSLIGATQN